MIFIWPLDGTETVTTILALSEPSNNVSEGVLHIP